MVRCENCGKRNPDPICASCLHHKKKEALRAAQEESSKETNNKVAPPKPATRPDMDDLRERMRQIQETLLAE